MILTDREQTILVGVASGRTNKEIARLLGISHYTVKNHVTHLYEKLEVRSRAQAIFQAVRLGLLDPHT